MQVRVSGVSRCLTLQCHVLRQFSTLMLEQVEDYVTRTVSDAVVVLQG